MKPITIPDVAKAARVSLATVSYVLNHTGRVVWGTRRAVRAAICGGGNGPLPQGGTRVTWVKGKWRSALPLGKRLVPLCGTG